MGYQTFELYFVPTSKDKGRQLAIKEIRDDNVCGIEFAKIGIKKGWVLTKIGHDVDATKLLYKVAKNRLKNLKISKQYGYQLTFCGKELTAMNDIECNEEQKEIYQQKYDDPIINFIQSIEQILIAQKSNDDSDKCDQITPSLISPSINRYNVGPFINHNNEYKI